MYFKPEGGLQSGRQPLHRQMWIDKHGPIPTGFDVHHRDRNPAHNDDKNFELLSASDHDDIHRHRTKERKQQLAEHANRIRPLTAEWHRSEQGRAWHRQHARESWAKQKPHQLICQKCQKPYETMKRHTSKYCSGRCKAAALRQRRRSAQQTT